MEMTAEMTPEQEKIEQARREIAEGEARAEALYAGIGRAVAGDLAGVELSALEQPATDEDRARVRFDGIYASLAALRSIEDTRKQLEEEIARLMAVKRCSACRTVLADDALFCPVCGTRVIKMRAPEQADGTCPQCGTPVEEGASFCIRCGFRLAGAALAAEPEEAAEAAVTQHAGEAPGPQDEPAQAAAAQLCPKCGAELEPDAVYCNMCGARVR